MLVGSTYDSWCLKEYDFRKGLEREFPMKVVPELLLIEISLSGVWRPGGSEAIAGFLYNCRYLL